ncbi:MAG: HAD-IA family hydrolase [Alphaproteobacteria bacterium]
MAEIQLVVFDCDGTLVDSQVAIVGAMCEASRRAGLAVPAAERIRRVVGLNLHEAVHRLFPELEEDGIETVSNHYKDEFLLLRQNRDFDEPLYPGTRECLTALAESGVLLAVATGKSRRGLARTLAHHGLAGAFISLQTADTGPGKPHPEMLSRAMAEAGAERATTIMVGDTTFDMEMARNAGTLAIGVGWGYHAPEELRGAGARAVLDRFADLPPIVPRLFLSESAAGAPATPPATRDRDTDRL